MNAALAQPIARITRQRSGPMAGWWNWYCFINEEGMASGLSGAAQDGAGAKAAVEERIPLGVYHREPRINHDREFRRQRAIARRKGKL